MIKKFSSRETTNHISACYAWIEGITKLIKYFKYVYSKHFEINIFYYIRLLTLITGEAARDDGYFVGDFILRPCASPVPKLSSDYFSIRLSNKKYYICDLMIYTLRLVDSPSYFIF